MTRDQAVLALTARTCGWPPCPKVLDADSPKRFCNNNHRLRAHVEVKRLAQLLEDLTDLDHPTTKALLDGLTGQKRLRKLQSSKHRVEERLYQLRPLSDVRPQAGPDC